MSGELLGLVSGYYVLFSVLTLLSGAAELTPKAVKASRKFFMNRYYYYREFSAKQNEDGCKAILLWCMLHQHLLPKDDKKNMVIMLNCQFNLPTYNKQFEIDTRYGIIYMTILSVNNADISGFRVAITRRNRFFGREIKKNEDLLIKFLYDEVFERVKLYYAEHDYVDHDVEIKPHQKKYDIKIPIGMEVTIHRLHEKYLLEERARQGG